MNFADAIRQAARNAASAPKPESFYAPPNLHAQEETMNPEPNETPANEPAFEVVQPTPAPAPSFEPTTFDFAAPDESAETIDFAVDAVTAAPVAMPEQPSTTVQTGNVVRLELFLSPEQMNQLFRSLVATQHAMLTLREAAQYLRVHPATVEHMAQDGQLPGLLIEGRWRFPKSSLDEWLNIQVFKKGEGHAA